LALKGAILALLLLLPLPALADHAFCLSLRRAIAEAPRSFSGIPHDDRVFPAAVEAQRDVEPEPELAYAAILNIVLMRHGPRAGRSPTEQRYRDLAREVPRCVPGLRRLLEVRIPESSSITWRRAAVEVMLILDRPPLDDAFELSISVSRLRR